HSQAVRYELGARGHRSRGAHGRNCRKACRLGLSRTGERVRDGGCTTQLPRRPTTDPMVCLATGAGHGEKETDVDRISASISYNLLSILWRIRRSNSPTTLGLRRSRLIVLRSETRSACR